MAYLETAELFRRPKLDPASLHWRRLASEPDPLQLAGESPQHAQSPEAVAARGAGLAGAIAEAKRKLAESLGIASEKIEITIRL